MKTHLSALCFLAIAGSVVTVGSLPVTAVAQDAVAQIDTDCGAIQNAVMALHPIHVALVAGRWKVMSDGDYAVAEQTHKSITFADVYKQGNNYAWVHSHTFTAEAKQTATQLCFRQADGSLERVRQASTIPNLNAASAQVAYYSPDGKVIQKTAFFEVNDPAIATQVKKLAFYQVLP